MEKEFIKWYNKLLSRLLTLLGFGSSLALVACYAPLTGDMSYLDVNAQELRFPAEGGENSAIIVTEDIWEAHSDGYFQITPTAGEGPEILYVRAYENNSTDTRKGTVFIRGESSGKSISIQLYQDGHPNYLYVYPQSIMYLYEKGLSSVICINTYGKWQIGEVPSFVDVTPTKGEGTKYVTVRTKYDNVSNEDMRGYVNVEGEGVGTYSVLVVQTHK